ncbi:histone methyltransferase [Mycena metata]|uniref:Histone-lysine N-methyltransferase, H3 lysine-36 specific n=1 Tax=Mycena metata TaxID=1033252 RepID=A0AAD7NED2_9AGAR|nr:histone methyltransferase [Mycena metata]
MSQSPAPGETPLSAPSAPAEITSDLPPPPMDPKLEDDAEPPLFGSPSVPVDVKDLFEDSNVTLASTVAVSEVDESMPPSKHDSASSASSSSRSSTPSFTPPPELERAPSKGTRKKAQVVRQLIGDLPIARADALETFNEIPLNNYQNKSIGLSQETAESGACECRYRKGVDILHTACGSESNCINRLTQVECQRDDCHAGSHCQNQRFQLKQYADIEIVQTEKKGFGLRAEVDIPKDAFIYEYVGDIVNPSTFSKRMQSYAEEGIRHFYFMMLQKGEYIDATKSGGIGRFANHSCNPNCFVSRWIVGAHVRMGIFAKRKIEKHEELTFNYNVDRYGHKAQKCYCGEPQCVGFIGGKTQTDLSSVDDIYMDALGITDEDEVTELKGTKKKKGKKLDDNDFLPEMRAILEKEIPKIMQALRQTPHRALTVKLLTRFRMTSDQNVTREMLRLRCLSLMKNVLEDNASDAEIVLLVLDSIKDWPLSTRNKIEDSSIDAALEAIIEKVTAKENPAGETKEHSADEITEQNSASEAGENTSTGETSEKISVGETTEDEKRIKLVGQELLDKWAKLTLAYRIPKRVIKPEEEEEDTPVMPAYTHHPRHTPPQSPRRDHPIYKRPRYDFTPSYDSEVGSPWTSYHIRPGGGPVAPRMTSWASLPLVKPRSTTGLPNWDSNTVERKRDTEPSKSVLDAVIAAAIAQKAADDAAAAAAAAAAAEAAKKAAPREHKRKHRSSKKAQTSEEKEANKEKRLLKLVGAVVVKCMSKYGKSLERDTFKKHAKELTQLIADKEKKSASYKENKLEALSDEKVTKIKKFSKEYIAKVVRKMEKSGHKHRAPSSSTAQTTPTAVDTPNSIHGVDAVMTEMTVEEAMDMDPASESDEEGELDEREDKEMEVDEDDKRWSRGADAPLENGADMDMYPPVHSEDGAPMDASVQAPHAADPRRRPPLEDEQAYAWDPYKPTTKLNGVPVA